MDLRHAFEIESQGNAFINLESLSAIFAGMQIFPTPEQLTAILATFGKRDDEEFVSFELFARSVALMLEEAQEKASTSSQQQQDYEAQDMYGDEEAYYEN